MIEPYLSCLEERLLDIEIPSKRFNNLTNDERNAMYSLKDDKSIIIKGADKGAAVIVWDREDYQKEARKQGLPRSLERLECTCEHFFKSFEKM